MKEKNATDEWMDSKLYVEAGVVYAPNGTMEPKYIRLAPAGEIYMIDKVCHRQSVVRRRAGRGELCYFVKVRGKDAKLYCEESPGSLRWYVWSKHPVNGSRVEA